MSPDGAVSDALLAFLQHEKRYCTVADRVSRTVAGSIAIANNEKSIGTGHTPSYTASTTRNFKVNCMRRCFGGRGFLIDDGHERLKKRGSLAIAANAVGNGVLFKQYRKYLLHLPFSSRLVVGVCCDGLFFFLQRCRSYFSLSLYT